MHKLFLPIAALAALCGLPPAASHAEDPDLARFSRSGELWPHECKVGDAGPIVEQKETQFFEAERILSDDELALKHRIRDLTGNGKADRDGYRTLCFFVVKGLPTKDVVTGRRYVLKGYFKVTGAKKMPSGNSYLIFEPESQQDRAKREAAENAAQAEKERMLRQGQAADAAGDAAKDREREAAEKARQARALKEKQAADEKAASSILDIAEAYAAGGKPDKSEAQLRKIVERYPATEAAKAARKQLGLDPAGDAKPAASPDPAKLLTDGEKREADAAAAKAAKEKAAAAALDQLKRQTRGALLPQMPAVVRRYLQFIEDHPDTQAAKEAAKFAVQNDYWEITKSKKNAELLKRYGR